MIQLTNCRIGAKQHSLTHSIIQFKTNNRACRAIYIVFIKGILDCNKLPQRINISSSIVDIQEFNIISSNMCTILILCQLCFFIGIFEIIIVNVLEMGSMSVRKRKTNVRKNRRANHEWTSQRHWQHYAHEKQVDDKQTNDIRLPCLAITYRCRLRLKILYC